MPAQTLQSIENGKTKGLSVSARRLLAPVLQVRDDVLLLPVGHPIDPRPGEPPANDPLREVMTALPTLV
jgi:hypothetical protein